MGTRKAIKKTLLWAFRLANIALDKVEIAISPDAERPLKWPPIFIISAPRTGTTLLYQVMINQFELGYLSNLHEFFYGGPSLLQAVAGRFQVKKQVGYKSHHGRSKGLQSPSECGDFWYRFFPHESDIIRLHEACPEDYEHPLIAPEFAVRLRRKLDDSILTDPSQRFAQRRPTSPARSGPRQPNRLTVARYIHFIGR